MIVHLLWSTATALAALGVVWLLRKRRAALRFTILLLALLRFAVPTAWLTDAGRGVANNVPESMHGTIASGVAEAYLWGLVRAERVLQQLGLDHRPLAPSSALKVVLSDPDQALNSSVRGWPYVVWWLGVAGFGGIWALRLQGAASGVRKPTPDEQAALRRACERRGPSSIPALRIVQAGAVPGACGWWRPTILLPENLIDGLSAEELDAILLHELAHLERADNLWAGLSRAIQIVFWFHPLVWWLRRKMLTEREAACDELVLESGTGAESYVTAIARVCHMAVVPALSAQSGTSYVNGPDLKQRMEHILSADRGSGSNGFARALPALLAVAAFLMPFSGGFSMAALRPAMESVEASLMKLQKVQLRELQQSGAAPNPAAPPDSVRLRKQQTADQLEQILLELRQAAQSGDDAAARALAALKQTLAQQLREFKAAQAQAEEQEQTGTVAAEKLAAARAKAEALEFLQSAHVGNGGNPDKKELNTIKDLKLKTRGQPPGR